MTPNRGVVMDFFPELAHLANIDATVAVAKKPKV